MQNAQALVYGMSKAALDYFTKALANGKYVILYFTLTRS